MPESQHLINGLSNVVDEMLEGLVMTSPGLRRLKGYKVVARKDIDRSKVSIISGGGSGHEPSHGGWVGPGMLTAAIAGDIFASPCSTEVLAALMHVRSKAGVLVIVKNYTGDRLNFGLAMEQAKAAGIECEMVIVGDDCALKSGTITGRRGVAGTLFVHKVAGAAAERGMSLAEVANEARAAAAAVGTVGVALRSCTLGQRDQFRIRTGTMEVGLGIHGESGTYTTPLETCDATVDRLLDLITSQKEGRGYLTVTPGEKVALLVNNLGGSTTIELHLAARAAVNILKEKHGVEVVRCFEGTFITSLDMSGISLSVLKVDESRLELLDAPAEPVVGWPKSPPVLSFEDPIEIEPLPAGADVRVLPKVPTDLPPTLSEENQKELEFRIRSACESIMDHADELDSYDSRVGDGDTGETLNRGAVNVLEQIDQYPIAYPVLTLKAIGCSLGSAMGGTSGAIYTIFINAAAAKLSNSNGMVCRKPTEKQFAKAFRSGIVAVEAYGGAKPGDRTMLDALVPAADALEASLAEGKCLSDALRDAASAAEIGACATRDMTEHVAGRSSYIPVEVLRDVPDPGAMGVAYWLRGISQQPDDDDEEEEAAEAAPELASVPAAK